MTFNTIEDVQLDLFKNSATQREIDVAILNELKEIKSLLVTATTPNVGLVLKTEKPLKGMASGPGKLKADK